ncbi:Acetyltransferase (GNAT) family protein [Micromonospora chersina]|uniref:Acetyltransferase (GNAT) family protein n=2 Tax=Micromonospora chersina TaxID=47854 RepID=A0A1C6W1K5_9ACTN|nr:Acetyltransferase (GNAT) family protein [Micromonospora chersina]
MAYAAVRSSALFGTAGAAIVVAMEPPLDIVPAPDRSGAPRWQALAPHGSVAGVAGLWPVTPFGLDFLLPTAPVTRPGAAELRVYVAPRWRRRGVGSRLLTAVREQTAVPCLVSYVAVGSPEERFYARHGFSHTRSWRHELLTYGDVHQAWLGELVDAEHPGYRLSHWTGDLFGAPRVEDLLRSPSRPGDAVWTAADADGDVGAYVVAVVGTPSGGRAHQYGPVVLPGHRGRRLSRWVNAALIQRLREVHPQVTEIETAGAADDRHLLATLRHLGFRPLRRTSVYELWDGAPS